MPAELLGYFEDTFPSAQERQQVFGVIRGRKLKYHDRHTMAEWVDVMRSEIAEDKLKRGKRPFSQKHDHARATEDSNGPFSQNRGNVSIPEPEGWRPWARANLFSPEWADKAWAAISQEGQRKIAEDYNRFLATNE